ncbi:ketohexokinase isoform X2 [Drosophila persimilis]|uniref:ketohexokinase isoform X1 n=1 Tax=Drosophila persimilis TaxID=7234 RepID=UPI00017FCBDF|nr:ketohexokinase isoform X1 [Drosophila persimilis]XP_026847954.1 ketohexokinase isoform X2 [Drosophila persimilis]
MSKQRGSIQSWAAGKKTVLCTGTTAMDYMSVVRRFPAAGADPCAQCLRGYWQRCGSASNNCTVLRRLGVQCEFFGMLSSLQMFRMLADDMRARGIVVENCPTCEQAPPFASVVLAKSPRTRNVISCRSAAFPHVSIEDFRRLDLSRYGWMHMPSMSFETTLAMVEDVAAFNAASHADKITVSLELSKDLHEMWPLVDYCDYVIFSKRLAREQGWPTPEIACSRIDERLRSRWGFNLKRPTVVFRWGDLGAGVLDESGAITLAPAFKPRKMVDSLGAGDTFTAAFIYAVYVRERSVPVAVEFANRLASHKCTKRGFDHVADILVAPVL